MADDSRLEGGQVSEKTYTPPPQGELAKTCTAYVSQIGTILNIGGEFDEVKAADLLYKFMGDLIYRAESGSPAGTPEVARTATPAPPQSDVAREPHDGWLNAWLYENRVPDESEFYRFAWHSKIRKMAGDWADFRARAEAQPAPQPTPPGTIWPRCDWCGADLEKLAKTAGVCPKCGACKFSDKSQAAEAPAQPTPATLKPWMIEASEEIRRLCIQQAGYLNASLTADIIARCEAAASPSAEPASKEGK
jgi:hypothetical protein